MRKWWKATTPITWVLSFSSSLSLLPPLLWLQLAIQHCFSFLYDSLTRWEVKRRGKVTTDAPQALFPLFSLEIRVPTMSSEENKNLWRLLQGRISSALTRFISASSSLSHTSFLYDRQFTLLFFFFFVNNFFTTILSQMGFLPWEIRVAFLGESQLRDSGATQPTVHAGCFNVSIIHRTLTWTTGSLTCAQMLMHTIAHGGVRTHVRGSALKVDSGRKIPCRTGESNLRQRRDGPML